MGKNIPIIIVLVLFVGSNAILYNYLNNGFFIDKKPETQIRELEKILVKLINDDQIAIQKAFDEKERRLRELNSQNIIGLSDAEKARLEAEKAALEEDMSALKQAEIESQNKILAAQQSAETSKYQMSELIEENNNLGADYTSLESQFDEYVTTLEDSAIINTESESEKSFVKSAFQQSRGLEYLQSFIDNSDTAIEAITNFIMNIGEEKTSQKGCFLVKLDYVYIFSLHF